MHKLLMNQKGQTITKCGSGERWGIIGIGMRKSVQGKAMKEVDHIIDAVASLSLFL